MADDTAGAPQGPGVGPLLPTQQANFFTVALNPSEVLLSVGQSRVAIGQASGAPVPSAVVEWLACLSISPVAATQLVAMLQLTLKTYEETFGKIPQDPAFKITANTPAAPDSASINKS